MKSKKQIRPAGHLRQSQLITTFGPGAMLDLVRHAVIVGGLDFWGNPQTDSFRPISEDRLLEKVKKVTGCEKMSLYAPPIELEDKGEKQSGITVFIFPEWFVVQHEQRRGEAIRARRLCHRRELIKGKWVGPDKRRYPVVPVRFVQACVNGHIADIDWHKFAHEYKSDCKQKLWLEERGTSGDLADIFVRCECGKAVRSLAAALSRDEEHPPLGCCNGHRPWLGPAAREECKSDNGKSIPNRLLVRSASDAYFAQTLSVISIPDAGAKVREAVDGVWQDFLQYAENADDVRKERRKAKVAAALEGFDDEAVFAEIERRKKASGDPANAPQKSIKQAEIETLLAQGASLGHDERESDFSARSLPLGSDRQGVMGKVDRVVLVDRLREVIAQVGFTRFDSAMADVNGELQIDVRLAPLAREMSWVPAIENRGEGFLVSFEEQALKAWENKPAVKRRYQALQAGFEAWKRAHPRSAMIFPSPRYIMLHTLSHLLISSVSLSCGYAASAIRERVYATESGSGILLYTGTPDAEGTLGGLVQVGTRIEEHLREAIEMAMLCSNDPVCGQHRPESEHEARFLHGAACHGCLLIAEPSCERRNEFLDRALLVPTVEHHGAEFFEEGDG